MMGAPDLRAFAYPLEQVQRQRQWRLDSALARLGELRRQVAECETLLARTKQDCVTHAAQAARLWAARADPAAQTALLGYVASLHHARVDAERDMVSLKARAEHAQRACALQQDQLEVLSRHRADELKAFTSEQHRRSGVQADQDWLGRESYSLGTGAT